MYDNKENNGWFHADDLSSPDNIGGTNPPSASGEYRDTAETLYMPTPPVSVGKPGGAAPGGGAFGATPTPGAKPYGAAPGGGGFGATPAPGGKPINAAPGGGAFGATPAPGGKPFNAAPGGGGFGAAPAPGGKPFNAAPGGGGFGAAPAPGGKPINAAPGGGGFGATPAPGGKPFNTNPGGGAFGAAHGPQNSIDYEKSLLQIKTYTRKFFRILRRESIISIIIGIVITLLVMYVTYDGMFDTFESTKSGLFALICACIWIGLFNSIQLVCREKNDIVKDELDKGLKASSYMAAHFIYQAVLCLIQSVIVFLIFAIFVNTSMKGFAPMYLVMIFMVMYASDAIAFVLSAAVPNPIVAMTFMPLLLLIQLVMAGVLFELNDFSEIISYFTVSRWGISALGMIGGIDTLEGALEQGDLKPVLPEDFTPLSSTDKDLYVGGAGDIFVCMLVFVAFIIAFYFLSVMVLKMTTKRIKK